MPPSTTTSTHCSHCTVHFCVLVLLMLLSGYHCQDICVNDPDRAQCIMDLNDIETGHENTGENCIKIEERTVGNSATFVCNIPNGAILNSLTWMFYPSDRSQDPETLEIQGRISVNTNQITINDIEIGDEGLYTCKYESPDDNGSGEGSMGEGLAGCILIYSTAKFVSQKKMFGILRSSDLLFPTELIFESSGFCGLHPTVSAARLQFSPFNSTNRTTLVLCEPNCNISDGITYDFENFGNITIPNAKEGFYMVGMQRPCPSPSSVITAFYTVTYSSPEMTNSPIAAATSPVIQYTTGNIPVLSPSMTLSQGHSTGTDEAITTVVSSSLSMTVSPSTEVHDTEEIDVTLYVSLGVAGAVVVLIVTASFVIICLMMRQYKPASFKSEQKYDHISTTDGSATVTPSPNETNTTTAI